MKKTLLTVFASLALLGSMNAQVSAYSFAASSGTYTAITGGTVLGDTASDDQRFVDPSALAGSTTTVTGVGFPIGFNFSFNGQVFDRFGVNNNGWIVLGQSSLTPAVDMSSTGSYNALSSSTVITPSQLRNRIAGFNDDLDGQIGSELRVETTGTAPNRVCVVQWKNYRKYSFSNPTGDSFNFQIRLKETSNLVEVVYGTITNNSSAGGMQVGLGGATSADFNARKTTTSWTATTAATTNSDVCDVTSTIKPASGQTFTWTPPAICTGTPTAGTASVSSDSTCIGVSFDLMLTGYTSNASGISFQWQSASSMTGTFTNISGATTSTYTVASQSATTYYKCVVTCSGSSATATSNVVSVINNAPMDCYCESAATSASDEDIINVTVGTLNNTSSCTTTGGVGSTLRKYSNYTATVAAPNLAVGSTVNFSVQVDTCNPFSSTPYSNAIKIYIDYNQNGSFADAGEKVYASDTAKGPQTITGTFVVSTGATNGNTRMRIVCKETSDTSTISSCGTYTWVETEDYTVNITGGSNVGIEENEAFNNVSIYPNPSTGLFNIVANNVKAETITVQVLDLQGKVVYSATDKSTATTYNKSINLEGLSKGFYYIKLNSGNGSKVQKIVIQ
ncbi:MAG: GEVED domain-containing protein [Bacteroidia bacterium]